MQILQEGRGPNIRTTGELRPAIEKWVNQKPIHPYTPGMSKKTLVFLIVRKIAREGIKVPSKYNPGGVISDVITEDLIDRIMAEVIEAVANRHIETVSRVI